MHIYTPYKNYKNEHDNNNNLIKTNHKLAANHQANRYRQSSSPARQRLNGSSVVGMSGTVGGANGSQLSVLGRGVKRNVLPPYRTYQTSTQKITPIGGSMQNMSPMATRPPRRSSAVGICNDNKSTMPSNYRSHSVDGLLESATNDRIESDERIAHLAALVAAGSSVLTNVSSTSTLQPDDGYQCSVGSLAELNDAEMVAKRKKSIKFPVNGQHRKSRSLDHFLDEQILNTIIQQTSPTEGTQSMQNLAIQPLTLDQGQGVQSQPCNQFEINQHASNTKRFEQTSTNTIRPIETRNSPEGISSTEDDHEESNTLCRIHSTKNQTRAPAHVHRGNNNNSKTSSSALGTPTTVPSQQSTNSNNKTIFNRTIKKVRSLIKKP